MTRIEQLEAAVRALAARVLGADHDLDIAEIAAGDPQHEAVAAAEVVAAPAAAPVDNSRMLERRYREALQAIDDPTPTAEEYPILAAYIGSTIPQSGLIKTDFDAVAHWVLAEEVAWSKAQAAALRDQLEG